MKGVKLQLLLSFFLLLLELYLFDLTADRLDVVLGFIDFLTLLPQLQVGVEQELEESSDAGSGTFEGLHVCEDHAVH